MATEEKKSGADRRYGGGEKPKEEPRREERREPERKPAKSEDGHGDEREAMHKRHETEARDLHGQHRTAMRDMHARQEKEMSDLNDRQQAPMGETPPADGEMNAAPAQGAPAGPAEGE